MCFVVAGVCLYICGKDTYGSWEAAAAATLAFALNPNVLYLATITMTEVVFIAGLAVCLLAVIWFRGTQKIRYIAMAVGASWWMSLTRYDGWFLIPFIALWLMLVAKRRKLWVLIGSGAMAALAPVYWMAHNWWETSNALDFYNGPYSAAAIQGGKSYPGLHDWPQAIRYYWEAGRLCCGDGLLWLGILGLAVAIWKGRWLAISFLGLTPLFYVWSMHSSKSTPIFVPTLWPHGYYNSRYGMAVVVLMAFATGSLVLAIPQRFRAAGLLLPLLTLVPWLIRPGPDSWICWKESQKNSDSRRAWTAQAAAYFEGHYQRGEGILTEFGDLMGVFGKAGIPLKEGLHEGNGPAWFANTTVHGVVQTKWAMAQQGDKLAEWLQKGGSFQVVQVIDVEGAPRLLIYERN
jgi:hypothetical protein